MTSDRGPNPFRPGFGSSPPKLVESDHHLELFGEALDSGPGAYGRILLLVGQRGTGKTVTLNALEDIAGPKGWLVISETATKGLVDRIANDRLPRLLRDHDPRPTTSRVTNLDLPLSAGGVGREVSDKHTPVPTLRSQLEDLTDILRDTGGGVLITLDEIHKGVYDELEAVTTTLQHAVRERRQVAFAAAGLPGSMTALLQVEDEKDPSPLTFLRRSVRVDLGSLSDADTARAFRDPIDATWAISDDALALAVVESHGYPYMVQLVGYHTWRHADAGAPRLEVVDVQAGLDEALRDLRRQVLDEAMKPLSANDRRYLAAMAQDHDEVSSTREVAQRLEVAPDYANKYRERLIDRALISGETRGVVEWAIPMLADYVRDLTRDPVAAEHWIRTGRTTDLSSPPARVADDLGNLGAKINELRSRRGQAATEEEHRLSDGGDRPDATGRATGAEPRHDSQPDARADVGPTDAARGRSPLLQAGEFRAGTPHRHPPQGSVGPAPGFGPGPIR